MPKQNKSGTNKLTIDAHEYDIIFDSEWGVKADADGSVVFDATAIILDGSIKRSRQEVTLFHEMLEIGNEHNEWGLEHQKIQQISSFFYSVLKGNKLLVTNFLKKIGAPLKAK